MLPQRLEDVLPLQNSVDQLRVGGKRARERYVEHFERCTQKVGVGAQDVLGNVRETSGAVIGLEELFGCGASAARLRVQGARGRL